MDLKQFQFEIRLLNQIQLQDQSEKMRFDKYLPH
jgi:hypothetical protein